MLTLYTISYSIYYKYGFVLKYNVIRKAHSANLFATYENLPSGTGVPFSNNLN